MIIGNFAALMQTNIKRMLAYSSIAHAGYVMVAVAAHSQIGVAAAMFYLAAYAFMNIGAFAVVTHFSRQGEKVRQHRGPRRARLEAAGDRRACSPSSCCR
jgi:NADH-quinone oxidoreductase subunit N